VQNPANTALFGFHAVQKHIIMVSPPFAKKDDTYKRFLLKFRP
jgi:hypothetical protein